MTNSTEKQVLHVYEVPIRDMAERRIRFRMLFYNIDPETFARSGNHYIDIALLKRGVSHLYYGHRMEARNVSHSIEKPVPRKRMHVVDVQPSYPSYPDHVYRR